MKKHIWTWILCALTLVSCFSTWQADEGTITINLGGGSGRSVWLHEEFDFFDDLEHIIKITGYERTITLEAKGKSSVSTVISAGHWLVTVDAFLEGVETPITLNRELLHYANGSAPVTVIPGQDNAVTLTMVQIEIPCKWGDWIQTTEPTCTEPGVKTRTCLYCEATDTETQPGDPKLGHLFTDDDNWERSGNIETRTCEREGCDEKETRDVWIDVPSFTITFAQLTNLAPDIIPSNIIIYLSGTPLGNPSSTANISVVNNIAVHVTNITWFINGIEIGTGSSLFLDSSNPEYNGIGVHSLTLEVTVDGIPYSKTVTFEVRQ